VNSQCEGRHHDDLVSRRFVRAKKGEITQKGISPQERRAMEDVIRTGLLQNLQQVREPRKDRRLALRKKIRVLSGSGTDGEARLTGNCGRKEDCHGGGGSWIE